MPDTTVRARGATRRSGRTARGGRAPSRVALLKAAIWVAALMPLAALVHAGFADALGADPIETVTHRTGWWGLTILLATLAVTPIRRLTGWNPIIKVRRLLGLFAFFYLFLHFGIYLADQSFALAYIWEDIAERAYVTAGFAGFVLLVPLALTSTRGMIRRLGGRRWQRLHRLAYLSAVLGVLHFVWLVKADLREPLIFAGVLAVLLAFRLHGWLQGRREATRAG